MQDWDDARFFLAVGRAGSFNAAARVLGVSQPTVSRRITALEATVGASLFDRHPEGLNLTELGSSLWDQSLAIESAVLGFTRQLEARSASVEGNVRVSATEGLGALWLTPRLAGFSQRHPALTVQVLLESRAVDLMRRQADLALRLSRPLMPDLIARKVGELAFGLFASADHVERHGQPTSVEDLVRHPLVALAQRESMVDGVWEDVIDSASVVGYSTNSSLAQIFAVRAGYGVGLLPIYAGRLLGLTPILAAQAWRRRDVWLVSHPDVKSSAKVRLLFDEIGQLFQSHGAELSAAQEPDFSI